MMQRSERQTAEANDLDLDITPDHLQRLTNLYQHYILKTSSWDELTVDPWFPPVSSMISYSLQFSSSHFSQSSRGVKSPSSLAKPSEVWMMLWNGGSTRKRMR